MIKKNIVLAVIMVGLLGFLLYRHQVNRQTNEIQTDAEKSQVATSESTPAPYEDWKFFRDKKEMYRVAYPGDWTLQDHSASNHFIRADIAKGSTAGLQIRVQKNSEQDFETFTRMYLDRFMKDMKGHWRGDIDVSGQKFTEIGKNQGFRAAIVFKRQDGQEWFFKEYLWEKAGRVVIFQAGCQYREKDFFEPLLDKIAATFEFGD